MSPRIPPDVEGRLAGTLSGANSGYVQDMYDRFLDSPGMVDEEWQRIFGNGTDETRPAQSAVPVGEAGSQSNGRPAAEEQKSETPPGATLLKGPAARLASNMTASLAIPTATSFREIDVATLEGRRSELNAALAPKKVSFTHLIGFAIVRAAIAHRSMSHAFAELDGQPHRVDPGKINLGLAVDVERPDGTRFLVVPVIKGAEGMDFAAFHASYEALVEKARTNKLSPDDLQGATITLTNPGTLGTSASVPRLMPGQGTIVATGAIRQTGERRVMTISSTYDHRIIQGAESGAFLRTIEQLLSGGESFYEDIFGSVGAGQPGPMSAAAAVAAPGAPAAASPESGRPPASVNELRHVAAAMSLVEAHRGFGHLAARLDPLGSEPPGEPALDPRSHGLTPKLMATIPADILGVHVPGSTLAEILPELAATYCGTIAYEVEHIASHDERSWLRRVIESGQHRRQLSADEKRLLLSRLTEVEALERFLHKAYLGQKRFSIEGLDVMVPMLELLVDMAGGNGAREVMIGMAHRGRLNVLAQIVGLPLESLFSEFEAGRHDAAPLPEGGMDDVKYHLGAVGTRSTSSGGEITVRLIPNPSHLEAVDPVVEGSVRAKQTDRSVGPVTRQDPSVSVPLLIHGDAAFAAQGVVAETFNLERLAGYTTGGTIHLISNNQLGFTTGPSEGRSTLYASDLAKGFDVPIVHVNADDAEACLAAVRLAMVYRRMFGGDVVIDLVGYRRYGHNEADEPSYTQPDMYGRIERQPTVRQRYQEQLVAEGVISAEEAEAAFKDAQRRFAAIQRSLAEKATSGADAAAAAAAAPGARPAAIEEPDTSVPADELVELNREVHSWPDGFNVHPKLIKQIERRREAPNAGARIEWGHAEALAFASLLADGVPIRLTGQDTIRGTFSQRHATLYDVKTGEPYTPIHHLSRGRASFELHNSPLSEFACMGFEYGYAVTVPEALVVWEAQYGDFANNAAVIIDQFIIAGLAKWGQTSRLTLLLPHGYEGAGPEHSSARLERFLALGAEGNIRVVNASTAAQYFHLLRNQAHRSQPRPLVVMTPKSLLRLGEASSPLEELAAGAFQPVLDDPAVAAEGRADEITRLVLCSGKVYYDMLLSEERAAARQVAIARVELLYPFPAEEVGALIARYPNLREILWVQEEPRNMGARKFVRPKLDDLAPEGVTRRSVTRPERSRPAEGYARAHQIEQARIVREALS